MVSTELMVVWMGLAVVSGFSLSLLFFDSSLEKYLIRRTAMVRENIKHLRRQIGATKTASPEFCQEENNDRGA